MCLCGEKAGVAGGAVRRPVTHSEPLGDAEDDAEDDMVCDGDADCDAVADGVAVFVCVRLCVAVADDVRVLVGAAVCDGVVVGVCDGVGGGTTMTARYPAPDGAEMRIKSGGGAFFSGAIFALCFLPSAF